MPNYGVKVSYQAQDFKKWAQMLSPIAFKKVFGPAIQIATRKNAELTKKAMIRIIKTSKTLASNANLTTMIKGSNTPLVDQGTLVNSIRYKKIDEFSSFVGIKAEEARFKIISLLHEGTVLNVTPEMRGMFFYLWLASEGKLKTPLTGRAEQLWARRPFGWLPLKDSTTKIVIPGRPFVKLAMMDNDLKRQMEENWNVGLKDVFRALKKEFFG